MVNNQLMTCLICYCTLSATGQTITFSKTYDFNNGDDLASSIVVLPNGYFVMGEGWGYETENYFDTKLKYVLLDEMGNITYQKIIFKNGIGIYPQYRSMLTDDGHIAFAGGYVDIELDDSNVLFGKIDPNSGDTTLFRVYPDTTYRYANCIQGYSDGNFLISMFSWDAPLERMKVKPNGDIIWENNYGAYNEGTAGVFTLLNDTLHLVSKDWGCEAPGVAYWRIIDSSGALVEEKNILGACGTTGFPLQHGDFIGGGSEIDGLYFSSYIFKYNIEGSVQWQYQRIEDFADSFATHVSFYEPLELPDGSIVVIGAYDATFTVIGSYVSNITKLNREGDVIWYREYQANSDDYDDSVFNSLKPTADGGFIMAGSGYSEVYEEDQNFWVLKLDSMGCLTPGCDSLDVGIMPLPQNNNWVLYPNPANQVAVLQTGTYMNASLQLQVLTTQGQLVHAGIIESGTSAYHIPTHNLPNGLYLLQLQNPQEQHTLYLVVHHE